MDCRELAFFRERKSK